jgi:hypothetical protein
MASHAWRSSSGLVVGPAWKSEANATVSGGVFGDRAVNLMLCSTMRARG